MELLKAILDILVSLFKSEQKTPTKVSNVNLIKDHEGLRLDAYLPTRNDVPTIGYGHTKGVFLGQRITEKQAEKFLREDLAWVEEVLNTSVHVPLTQNQYDALASLVFNIGGTAFKKSTLLRKLNSFDYSGAADQFLVWNKQKGLTLAGLVKRRAKERSLFLS